MAKIHKLYSDKSIAIIISLIVFIYLILRAINVPLTHDEAATFFHFIQSGNFIPLHSVNDVNNHFLNSLFTYISYLIFNDSEIALRLPNLLSFPLFAIFTFKISSFLNSRSLKWILFLSLILSNGFIEYFALTRGYGMSMSFLIAALYFLILCINTNSSKHYSLTLLFATLATFANLTIIIPLTIITFILFVNYIIKHTNKDRIIKPLIIIIQGIIPIIIFSLLLLHFKNDGRLYYGTMDGFWDSSVLSLLKLLSQSNNIIYQIAVIIALLSISSTNIYSIFNTKFLKYFLNKSLLLSFILWASFVSIIILATILDINYPEDRTGMYFYPLFILSFIFSVDYLISQTNNKLIIIIAAPLIFLPIHFVINMNISYSSFWKNERIPERFIDRIKETSSNIDYQPTIGGSHIRVLCFAYYNYRNGGELNQVQRSVFPELYSDYQIVNFTESIDWLKNYNIIDFDEFSELRLLKKKSIITQSTIFKQYTTTKTKTKDKYFSFIKLPLDTLVNKALLVNLEFEINSNKSPFKARIVLKTKDKNTNIINYDYIALNWKQAVWNSEHNKISASFIIPKLPKNAKLLSLYLWNINDVEYLISNTKIEIKLFQHKIL